MTSNILYAADDGCGITGLPSRTCVLGTDTFSCGGRRAGVRCCSDTTCVSHCNGSDYCSDLRRTLADALRLCAADGMRLCSRGELRSRCCRQGCGLDSWPTWMTLDAPPPSPPPLDVFQPGQLWLDTEGHQIRAHSAGLLYANGELYLYGADSYRAPSVGSRRCHNPVINVYSSVDLYNWRYRGVALDLLGTYVDRPKPVRTPDGRFALWFKSTPNIGVAIADHPAGPFELISLNQPTNEPVGDITAFVDPLNGGGWLVYSRKGGSAGPRVLRFCPMSPSLTALSGSFSYTIWEALEAPALMYNAADRRYYLFGSHATGFRPNPARLFSASAIGGPWRSEYVNPTGSATSHDTQVTYILPVPTVEGSAFVYVGDRFHHEDMGTNPESGRLVWLPVLGTRTGAGVSVPWRGTWTLDELGTPLLPLAGAPPSPPSQPPLPPPTSPVPPPPRLACEVWASENTGADAPEGFCDICEECSAYCPRCGS